MGDEIAERSIPLKLPWKSSAVAVCSFYIFYHPPKPAGHPVAENKKSPNSYAFPGMFFFFSGTCSRFNAKAQPMPSKSSGPLK